MSCACVGSLGPFRVLFRVVFRSVPVRSVPENRDALYAIVYVTLQVKIKTEPAGYGTQKYVSL